MSKLIIAFGPGGSGKSEAAQAWLREPGEGKKGIIDEGRLGPLFFADRVFPELDAGRDIWLNILTGGEEIHFNADNAGGHEVEMRRFGRREYEVVE